MSLRGKGDAWQGLEGGNRKGNNVIKFLKIKVIKFRHFNRNKTCLRNKTSRQAWLQQHWIFWRRKVSQPASPPEGKLRARVPTVYVAAHPWKPLHWLLHSQSNGQQAASAAFYSRDKHTRGRHTRNTQLEDSVEHLLTQQRTNPTT